MCQNLYLLDKISAKAAVSVCDVTLHVAVVDGVSLQPDHAALLTLQHHALTHHSVFGLVVVRCIGVLVAL